jgi:hypothetical protein
VGDIGADIVKATFTQATLGGQHSCGRQVAPVPEIRDPLVFRLFCHHSSAKRQRLPSLMYFCFVLSESTKTEQKSDCFPHFEHCLALMKH